MKKQTIITTSIVAGAVVLAGVGVASTLANAPSEVPDAAPAAVATTPAEAPPTADTLETPEPEAAPAYDTTTALLFLIEEEKLAHDVYVTLGELWDSNTFTNIVESEATHQELVAPLLADRAITDPRSTEVGVFTDPDLQALYDELIARGSTSLAEAIQVGILIEEKDITDLSVAIAAEDEADVVSVLERLLAGSENHLEAFERRA
ncbi:DUF2202 domain-containing protein [Agromyces bauzanensis]|uniref:DUF2202 domain-containing protein n=1 Tax=Agromyces bauzanensis TaxID=1308924 RepID=A0A917UTJ7_9MICO|nr:DUF2202 domain-containing protein [Agromyces bauzanensis]GGJ84790.1 hypothetical protein GCM10011372_23880 [Agromyces bauzanensis]